MPITIRLKAHKIQKVRRCIFDIGTWKDDANCNSKNDLLSIWIFFDFLCMIKTICEDQ